MNTYIGKHVTELLRDFPYVSVLVGEEGKSYREIYKVNSVRLYLDKYELIKKIVFGG